jgi:hypothetical protein
MPLKIIKSDEQIEVKQIIAVVYGSPGIGKSTIGFSSESPLLFDFDKGAYRAANRKTIAQVEAWADVASVQNEDLAGYKTVIVDTVGRALDFLTADIIRRNSKMGYGGALTLQGYGQLKAEFTAWLKAIKTAGLDVVLLSHSAEDKKGDDLIERLDIQGGSKGEVYKSADMMGRLYIENGKRVLNFSPTDTAFGKNPGCFDPILVPDINTEPDFFAGIIRKTKERLNSLSEEQKKRSAEIAEWMEGIAEASTPQDFNTLVEALKSAEANILPIVKGQIHKTATEKGFVFEKGKGYVNPSDGSGPDPLVQ